MYFYYYSYETATFECMAAVPRTRRREETICLAVFNYGFVKLVGLVHSGSVVTNVNKLRDFPVFCTAHTGSSQPFLDSCHPCPR